MKASDSGQQQEPDSDNDKPRVAQFPVVAIGGSAGALDAFEGLFDALATNIGAAYLLIQHLKADQPSQLPDIIARHTGMPVLAAKHDMVLEPDHVYVTPPGKDLVVQDGCLQVLDPEGAHHKPTAIDRLFRSVARAQGALGAGVVLSGMGSDGSLGIKAIKAAGGLVLVQDPETAQFDGMPRSAIATDAVDRILGTAELATALHDFMLRHNGDSPVYADHQLEPVLELLRHSKRHDFRGYKRPMLSRRISRRVSLAGLDTLNQYLQLLRDKPEEVEQLHRDLLISVTDFFRDVPAYGALQNQVLPQIAARAGRDTPIRAWIPACATGEEAYTIAMLMHEAARAARHDSQVNVFASDIDERALEVARAGLYPANISADVPAPLLTRYFTQVGEQYRVSSDLRQNIVFAAQDLLRDPPYSRLDLISCRNLLIYLSPDLQKYVLALFHFALRDGGYLFLGNAETIGQASELFEPVDSRHRIYRRIAGAAHDQQHFPFSHRRSGRASPASAAPAQGRANNADRLAQQLLLREYVPGSVLINRKAEILCAYGPTHRYLALPTGTSRLDLMEMAAEDLRSKLRAITHQAIRENKRCQVTALRNDADALAASVRITVRPLQRPPAARGLLMVTFEDLPVAGEPDEPKDPAHDTDERRLAEELRVTREELQSTITSLEIANEDLQGSNEEVMSVNEELQSTNEELETSKEELQSLNEELSTVNNELQNKIQELERLNNDLANLFSGTRVATLFLDRELRIMRFTPAIEAVFNLLHGDIGRPLRDIKFKFEDPQLLTDAAHTLDHLVQREQEVEGENGRAYLRRILPYRTLNDVIDGVVITFTDITELHAANARARENEAQLRLLADALPALIACLDDSGRYVFANAAHSEWFDISPERLQGRALASLFVQPKQRDSIQRHCKMAMTGKRVAFEDTIAHHRLGQRTLDISFVPINGADGSANGFYFLGTDITERKLKTETLLDRHAEAAHANRIASMSELAATIAHQMNQPLGAINNYASALRNRLNQQSDPESLEIARKLGTQARAAGDIMKELREFIGRRTFDEETVDLNALVRRVMTLTEARTANVNAQIKLSLDSDLPALLASPVQLEQLLVNLVVNALEAVEQSEKRVVSITTESRDGHLLLRVDDTGPGIAVDEISRVFNAFYTNKQDGMGMGLAICRGIAEDYGGKLWVESEEGEGATFILRLPVGDPPQA